MAIQTRISGALRALVGSEAKSNIWGSDWRSFMGISGDGGGVGEIGPSSSDWMKARTSESYVYRCIDVRGNAIAQVPLRVWEVDKAGQRKAIEHPALEVLESTNELSWVDGIPTLMRYTLAAEDLTGRSVWKLAFNSRKMPTEIFWLPPNSVRPVHGFEVERPDLPFGGVKYSTVNGIQTLPPEQIVYFATPNPDDPIRGTSKIDVLRRAINLRAWSQDANLKFFKNSMLPPWVLTTEKNLTEEAHDRIMRNLRRWLSGANNQTPLIVGGGTDAKVLAMSHEDAKWVQQQALVQEEISATFGVPLIYLNNYDRATYDNVTTAKLIFWHDAMIPEGDELAGLLTRRFLWRFWPDARTRKYSFGFDYNQVEGLGEDVAKIWERFTAFMHSLDEQVQRGSLLPNQARVALAQLASQLGLDSSPWEGDVPGGETFLTSYLNIPVTEARVQTVIDVMAARGNNPQLETDVPGAPNIAERAELPDPSHPAPGAPGISQQQAQQEIEDENQRERDERRARESTPKGLDLDDIRQLLRDELAELRMAKATDVKPLRDARVAPIEAKLERRLKKWFQGLQQQSLRNLRRGSKAAVMSVPDADTLYDHGAAIDELLALLEESYGESAEQAYEAASKDHGLDVSWDVHNPFVEEFVGARMHLIKGIDQTTTDDLKETLTEGLDEGDDMEQLAQRVSQVFKQAIASRAATIARTECLIGTTRVRTATPIVRAYRRHYDGEVVTIATAAGHQFTATPNHPVLTDGGWVGAGALKEGDHLFRSGLTEGVLGGQPDVQDVPPTIAEVFGSLAEKRLVKRESLTPMDFHGDGMDGDVEVVRADGNLALCAQVAPEKLQQLQLAASNSRSRQLVGVGEGGEGQGRFAPTLRSSERAPRLTQSSKPSPDGIETASEVAGKFQHGCALAITTDEVIWVKRKFFSGHVYNLQTEDGTYAADDIVTHNCIQAYGQASIASYAEAGIEQALMHDGPHDDSANCASVDGMVVSLSQARALMGDEHPNGVRGVSPVVDLGLGKALRKELTPDDTPAIVTDPPLESPEGS